MELIHLIYTSAPTKGEFSRADLNALLVVARKNNAAAKISGLLLYQNGSFFQILEGERESVETLFLKISGDKRHNRITKIIVEVIDRRNFGEWKMGFPDVSPLELATIPGLNDFFTQATSFHDLGEGRAKMLLSAFREGRWRKSIS
jgi:hypothetical protein